MGTVVQDCTQSTPLTLDFSNAISEYLSGCDGYGNYGYWVKITWPASGSLTIHNTGSDVGVVLLDACGGNELYCNNNSLGTSLALQSTSLSGADIWMYFWKDSADGTADICLQENTCPFPTSLSTNNITETSADLSWTENGSASTWNIEYGPAGFAQGSGTVISGVTTNPYTLSGLSQGTDYDFYVQADCGGGDTSVWSGPGTFSTACGIITPDYSQDFTSFLPNCWDENTGPVSGPTGTSGSSLWTSDGFANNGSSGSARVNLYTNTHNEWLLSPHFDLSGDSYELNFDVAVTAYSGTSASAMGSDDQVQLLISTDGGNNWSNLMTWDVNNTPSNTGDNLTIDLSAYNQTDVQFAFWASDGSVNDAEDYNFYVDNFIVRVPPTCPNPTQGIANNITNNSAQLSWTLGGNETTWNIEYGPAGFTQGNGTIISTSSNPYTLTGLTPGIMYDWYVQADCGGGDTSTWDGPYVFTTLPGCGGKFYDEGGPNNDYSAYSNQVVTIYPDNPGDAVTVTFNSFEVEQGWDGMIIKNGPSTSSPIISSGSTYNRTNCPNGAWTGSAGGNYSADGMSFTSTDPSGALTFIFKSDFSVEYAGWDADVTCNPQPSCDGIIPDYTEDFTYYLPSCWKEGKGNPSNLNIVDSRWTYDGFLNSDISGSARIYMYGTQTQVNDWFISPSFDLSTGGYELSFKVGITGFSNSGGVTMGPDDFVKLMVSTDGGNSWTEMTQWNSLNNPSNIGDYFAFDLSNYAGNSDVKFAYYANTGTSAQGGYNFYVDDFVISASECAAPSNLTTTITGTTSAILSWTDTNAGSASYLVEWKPVNSTTWDNYTTAAGATSYTVTGLTADTEYQWRVTSDCGAGLNGPIVSGNNFIPTCVPIVPNYLQEFTTYLDECWMEGKGNMTSFYPANSRWTNDGFANNGTTGAARIVLYANPNDSWLISPEFNLSGGSYTLEMDVAVTGFSNIGQAPMGADDEVNVQISTDGGITWSVIYTWTANNVPSNSGDHVAIDLSNYNGFAKFAIVASDGSTADSAYNFYIDNFAVSNTVIRPTVIENTYDVNIGQNDKVYRIFTTDKQKMLNVTAYDVSGREIYRAMNINSEEVETQINVKAGSLIIFRIEMPDHSVVIKKSIKR